MANYTLNYTGEKVDELLNKIDAAFGEETVMGDTLTWDGEIGDRVNVEMQFPVDDAGNTTTLYFVKVSNAIPTMEELEVGGSLTGGGQVMQIPSDAATPTDVGSAIMIGQYILIAEEDNADLTEILGITLPEKGIYFVFMPEMGLAVTSLTITNYTGFEMIEITPLAPKYLTGTDIVFVADNLTSTSCTATCNKTFAELIAMPLERLRGAVIEYEVTITGAQYEHIIPVIDVATIESSGSVSLMFAFVYTEGLVWKHFVLLMTADGIEVQIIGS